MTDTNDPTTPSSAAPRGEHEATYLAMVDDQLDGLPAGRRAELLAVVADNLDERPPALSWDLLIADLGTPAAYAAQLDDGSSRRARRTPQRNRRRRWLILGASAAVLLPVAIITGRRVLDDPAPPPELSTNCWGPYSDDPRFTFEHHQAGSVHEYRLDHREGVEFRIPVCLTSLEQVEVLDISFASALDGDKPLVWDNFPFHQIGEPGAFRPDDRRPPPTPDAPIEVGPGSGVDVGPVMRFSRCDPRVGSWKAASNAAVTYRYDGKEITEAIDLGAVYSVHDVGSCTPAP